MAENGYTYQDWINQFPMSPDEWLMLQKSKWADICEPVLAEPYKICEQLWMRGYFEHAYAKGNIWQRVYRITEAGRMAVEQKGECDG